MKKDEKKFMALIRRRAENLFLSRQFFCTEAVLSVLNQGLNGGLPPELAIRLVSGLPEGVGGSGCLCGALNGGSLALGLFMGRNGPGFFNRKPVVAATRELHDRFKARFGASCCRVLTKKLDYGSPAHFRHCAQLTGETAEMTARILLQRKPKLENNLDWDYLRQVDSVAGTRLKQIRNLFQEGINSDRLPECIQTGKCGDTVC